MSIGRINDKYLALSRARVAKLVDALVLGTSTERFKSSSLFPSTTPKYLKMRKKLHISETVLLLLYLVLLASMFLFKDDFAFVGTIFSILSISSVSAWSMSKLKIVSVVLWPFYIYLGMIFGLLLGNLGGSGPGAAIGFFIALILFGFICIQILLGLIFATRDSYKIFILIALSVLALMIHDRIFISPNEIGERGRDYYLEKYSDWRVLE